MTQNHELYQYGIKHRRKVYERMASVSSDGGWRVVELLRDPAKGCDARGEDEYSSLLQTKDQLLQSTLEYRYQHRRPYKVSYST